MSKVVAFAYGLGCYVMFLGVFVYAVGFLGDFGVPKSIDSDPTDPFYWALLIDIGLIAVFGIQHSVMARPSFKKLWTIIVPKYIERSTYVLFTNLALVLLFWQWRPMGVVVWNVEHPVARGVIYGVFAMGWIIVLVTTFLINHFDLFGLRQIWLHLRGKEYTHLRFVTPGPYKHIRHPLYVGWFLAFWATPTMTIAHLVFALGTAVYILIAIRFEERDLIDAHGQAYERYRNSTPMFVPAVGRTTSTKNTKTAADASVA